MARRYRPETLFFNRPEAVLAGSFAVLILVGTILLSLPAANRGSPIGLLDALFTATSAVCVTGLIVVDTGSAFSPFGHTVILGLIQLGGLGIMTFAALTAQLMGRRMSFRSQALIAETIYQGNAAAQVRRDLKRIVFLTFGFELIGFAALYQPLRGSADSAADAAFSSAFHSISAFCNAGFSLYKDSLTSFGLSPWVMITIMLLIIAGGLGHTVVLEIFRRGARRITARGDGPVVWSLHSRVVIRTSLLLTAVGAGGFVLMGLGDTDRGWLARTMNAVFQSVTARTAGFNTVDLAAVPLGALLVLVLLMFIGGSPASCAGGVKTTSAAVIYAEIRARLGAGREATLLGRRLPNEIVSKTILVIGLAVAWNMIGCLVLSLTELPHPELHLEQLLFEQVSAFGTVGLSTGITAQLSALGKTWIIVTMFVGRLGPLTAALAVLPRDVTGVRYPEERVMIG